MVFSSIGIILVNSRMIKIYPSEPTLSLSSTMVSLSKTRVEPLISVYIILRQTCHAVISNFSVQILMCF